MINFMAKVNIKQAKVIIIKVNFNMIEFKDLENISIMMDLYMKDNFKIIKNMVWEL